MENTEKEIDELVDAMARDYSLPREYLERMLENPIGSEVFGRAQQHRIENVNVQKATEQHKRLRELLSQKHRSL